MKRRDGRKSARRMLGGGAGAGAGGGGGGGGGCVILFLFHCSIKMLLVISDIIKCFC